MPADLPVKYYGKIDWGQEIQEYEPLRKYKLFKRIPDALKTLIKLLDSLTLLENLLSCTKRIGIIAAGKLERERDEVAIRAYENPKLVNPSDGFIFTHNGINFLIANYLGIRFYKGLGIDHVCSSGNDVIGIAHNLIKDDVLDSAILVAINSMASVSRTSYHKILGVVSKSGKIRPFDEKRDGTVFADGIAIGLVTKENIMEKLNISESFSIEGYEMVCDSYHMFSLDDKGTSFKVLVEALLNKRNIPPHEIEFIKAHATGTKLNDLAESIAYNNIFGNSISVTALKPVTGHTVTASGLIETLLLLEYLKKGKIPKTINHEKLSEECAKIKVLTDDTTYQGGYILSVSAGFGGFFSATILKGVKNGN